MATKSFDLSQISAPLLNLVNNRPALLVVPILVAAVGALLRGKKNVQLELFHNRGNFLPIRREIEVNNLTPSFGSIPNGIDGLFVRNGPNPLFPSDEFHWFEGHGMLHSVRIANGTVSYKNKFVQTSSYSIESKETNPYFYGIFQLKGILGLVSLIWQTVRGKLGFDNRFKKETANTATIYHAGRFFALMEADQPHWIQTETLETNGKFNYGGNLNHNFTAHPKVDQKTGELLFFGYAMETTPYVQYCVVDKDGNKQPSVDLQFDRPIMMHDFAITQNYSIFLDLPLIFVKENILKSDKNLFEFRKNERPRIGIFPRHSKDPKDMKWFDVKGCFCFHVANAWEDGDKITLILSRYEDFDLYAIAKKEGNAFKNVPKLHLYTFNMKTNEVRESSLGDTPIEFPTINESLMGYKNRYIYGASIADPFRVFKVDLETLKETFYTFEKGCDGGEFVFIPKENPQAEDDGWLIGLRYVANKNNSEVVILNASDMSEQAIVPLPQRVPQGFHARWLTKEMLHHQIGAN